jgi:outer membrane lipase/esterase
MAPDFQATVNDSPDRYRTVPCDGGTAPIRPARSRWRAALRTSVIAAIGSVALAATLAPAQAQFTRVFGFGDSYADTGAAPGGAFRIAGAPCIYGAICSFTDGITFVQALGTNYGLPGITNYAIGGARTDNSNTFNAKVPPPPNFVPGFEYELAQSAGLRYAASDLIALSIGGNDLSASNSLESVAAIENDAIASAQREVAGVQQMAAQGARNIVIFGTGSSVYFPQPSVDVNGVAFSTPQRDGWADTYYQQTEQLLAPLAHSGVRIFLLDFAVLQSRLAADPGQYGFASATNCEAGPADGPLPSGVSANVVGCFYENSVHPTGAGMQLVANYMTNQIDAPTTVVSQGAIATALATNFTGSVFGRLDAYRTFDQFDMGATSAIASTAPTKGLRTAAPENRWSVYGGANYSGGSGEQQFLAPSYNYNAVGGTLGLEYRVDPNLRLGAVFGYSAPDVHLNVQNAHDHIDSYQFAGYGSFTSANWFADALVAYGRDEYALDRQGVIDVIHGATSADVFTAAAQAGYLADVGSIRVGPIAGFDYTHAGIHAYTETGDSLLTMMVGQQSVDNLIGDIGFELRTPFAWRGNFYSPFVNVTAQKEFLGGGRVVTTTQVTTPLLPVLTPVPDNNKIYGQVAAGVAASLGGNVSASLNAATTFARQGGNDFSASLGIKVAF